MEVKRKNYSWVKWIILAAVGIAAVAAGLWTQWLNAPEIEYYNAYISRYEIPEGIYPLTEEQRKTAADCYRITTKDGRVIRLECVNSKGTLIDPIVPTALTDYPRQDFTKFDEQGRPTEIELYNAQGVLMRRKLLQYQDDTNQIIIDFQLVGTDSNQTMVTQLTSGMNDESVMIIPSHILRQVNTYNNDGLLVRCAYYKSAGGTPVCDRRYVYARDFEYTDQGQVARITNLNAEGQRFDRNFGHDVQEFTYDETGTVTSVTYCGATIVYGKIYLPDDYFTTTYVVDSENGNVLQSQRLDKNDAPCNDSRGVFRTEYTYDSQGFLVSRKQFDSDGQPTWDSNGCHEYIMTYEPKYGRVNRISCMDVQGEPCLNLYGYATVEATWDEQGRELEEWLYDARGNLCQYMELGICGAVYTYNKNGFQESCCYYGEQRQPVLTSDGYHRKQLEYDERGNLIREAWYDTEGKAVCLDGYSTRETEYDAWGNVLTIRFNDVNGTPVLNSEGYHMIQNEYGETFYQIRQTFHDIDGQLTMTTGGYAVIERVMNSMYGLYGLDYYDLDLWPIAYTSWDYNGDDHCVIWTINDELEGILINRVTDLENNPSMGYMGYHELRQDYNEHGQTTRKAYYDLDGNLVCPKWQGYAVAEWDWVYFDKGGYTDARIASHRVYDENGEPAMCDDGYHELRREYDENGRLVRECKYDAQGNLLKEKVQNWDD